MNRQSRTLLVVLVALAAAAVASYGVYTAISKIPVREVEIATRSAVVAAKDMPMGTRITADTVKVVAWPERTPLAGGFASVERVLERVLISAVVENEPLTESKLAPKEAGAGLPPSIPEGMRAMSVKVNEVIGVAGFVVPGTHVDVMVILQNEKANGLARVVVSNVQVLTAGTRYDQENARKDGKPIPSTVVTLMVNPVDAEKIALAQAEGQLMLSLRNPLDTAPTDSRGVRTATLFAGSSPASSSDGFPRAIKPRPLPAAVPPPPPPPATRAYTVEAIRAAKRTEEVVREENVP
jgi:pilus assembly protein CpaB